MIQPAHSTSIEEHAQFSDFKNTGTLIESSQGSPRHGSEIDNVLKHVTREEMLDQVQVFVEDHSLQKYMRVFCKELSEADKSAIEYEGNHKWTLPWRLYYAAFVCAIGAATQGWDQTGSNGANLSFPQEFGIGASIGQRNGARDEWIVGLVNSAPYLSASIVGVWLSDPLNALFGRKGEIFLTAICLTATPIAAGFTRSWQALTAVRLVMGLGLGAKGATVPMYSAELAPASIRGALTMGWQLWTAFGIFIGFCANAVVKDAGHIAWRLQIGSAFIPAFFLAIGIPFCVESPRWLMKKGRMVEAWQAMRKIRNHDVLAARDLYYAYAQFQEEQKLFRGRTYFSRLSELFTIPRCRRATLAASTINLTQQMCGINIISFYSSTIFVEGGFNTSQALFASIGFGALNFVFAIPAVFTIDSFGRRSLLLWTFPNMCWTLLAAGLCFYIDNDDLRLGFVALFIYLFTIAYSVGQGPVSYLYAAEVFPLAQREQGMAWSVFFNGIWASVLGFTFPRLLRALTPTGAFGFYAGMNAVAYVMLFLWIPETKQLTLEELDQVFSIPTESFVGYNVGKVVPHYFKKYILFQRGHQLGKLGFDGKFSAA